MTAEGVTADGALLMAPDSTCSATSCLDNGTSGTSREPAPPPPPSTSSSTVSSGRKRQLLGDDSFAGSKLPLKIEKIESAVSSSKTDEVGVSCPHVGEPERTLCSHCDKSFCKCCQLGHIDRVKCDTRRLFETIPSHFETTRHNYYSILEPSKRLVEEDVEKCRVAISEACEQLRTSLMAQVTKIEAQAISKLDAITKKRVKLIEKAQASCNPKTALDRDVLDAETENVMQLHNMYSFAVPFSHAMNVFLEVKQRKSLLQEMDLAIESVGPQRIEVSFDQEVGTTLQTRFESFVKFSLDAVENKSLKLEKKSLEVKNVAAPAAPTPSPIPSSNQTTRSKSIEKSSSGEDSLDAIEILDDSPERPVNKVSLKEVSTPASSTADREIVKTSNTKRGRPAKVKPSSSEDSDQSTKKRRSRSIAAAPAKPYSKEILTHLFTACAAGDFKTVSLIIESENGENYIEAKDKDSYSPVHIAAENGHLHLVQFFVFRHCNIENRCKEGQTPLLDAANSGHLNVVKFLIEKGADVGAVDGDGLTALHLAAMGDHMSIVSHLLEYKPDLIRVVAKDGETPLHCACSSSTSLKENIKTVRFLMVKLSSSSANREILNWKSHNKLTALQIAVNKQLKEISSVLRLHGCLESADC